MLKTSPGPATLAHSRPDPFLASVLALAPNLQAYATNLARDRSAAEDLVQETILKALTNREKFAEGSNLKAWLFTILRNKFLSDIRRGARISINSELLENERAPATPPRQEHALLLQEVTASMGRLPRTLRRALIIVGAEGHTYEQAARMEGCAIGTIKSRVSRARTALARLTHNVDVGEAPLTGNAD